jgi:pimeloyl-ACP methyl ester carboxylesterase
MTTAANPKADLMRTMTTKVGATLVAGRLHRAPRPASRAPLLVTLHGGLFTGRYFEVAGSDAGSFAEIANRNGFDVLIIDRPGYGDSGQPPDDYDYAIPEQARVLNAAINALVTQCGHPPVMLIAHSIGGMIAFEIAAAQPSWHLVGLSATGMGARIPQGGAAEQLGALPLSGVVDIPIDEREKLWYGPEGTCSAAGIAAARTSYAPAPMTELTAAPQWAAQRLNRTAPDITVPIFHALAEFDALWDGSPEARELFISNFSNTQRVQSEIVDGVGHCIEHHLIGASIHYQQLAFAHMCVHRQPPKQRA